MSGVHREETARSEKVCFLGDHRGEVGGPGDGRGDMVHPDGQRKANFMLFVDTGSRFMAGRVIHEKKTPGVTWEEMRQAFEEVWMAMFGKPKVLRVDPGGAWRSNAAEAYCNERNIILEPIPESTLAVESCGRRHPDRQGGHDRAGQ